jgi:hypothetical protein
MGGFVALLAIAADVWFRIIWGNRFAKRENTKIVRDARALS